MKINLLFACIALLLIVNLSDAPPAWAHRVTVFAWVDGDTVHTKSKFSGGKEVKGGKILVFGPEENVLLEGITDDNGEFSFRIPQRTELNIELVAGTGHRGQWTLRREELGAPDNGESENETLVEEDTHREPDSTIGPLAKPGLSERYRADRLTEKQVQAAVERVLDKKLKPVMETLSKISSPGPSPSDIFGGIGYILGLVGVAAYARSKKTGK